MKFLNCTWIVVEKNISQFNLIFLAFRKIYVTFLHLYCLWLSRKKTGWFPVFNNNLDKLMYIIFLRNTQKNCKFFTEYWSHFMNNETLKIYSNILFDIFYYSISLIHRKLDNFNLPLKILLYIVWNPFGYTLTTSNRLIIASAILLVFYSNGEI